MIDFIQAHNIACVGCGRVPEQISGDIFCQICRYDTFPFSQLADAELKTSICANTPIDYEIRLRELENNFFDPLELNNIHIATFDDVDPDLNYYNSTIHNNFNCNYYFEDTFNDKLKRTFSNVSTFSLTHLNIRSAQKNVHNFDTYLNNINNRFDIVGLCETWLNENNVERHGLAGYSHEFNLRKGKKKVEEFLSSSEII